MVPTDLPGPWTNKVLLKPIPKGSGKNPYIPTNYRTISLISCIAKIYSSLLNTRILNFLESRNILVEEQNGFRPKRSCIEHIFTLTSAINKNLNENKSVFGVFIDFEKAFDRVNRDLMIYSLLKCNIRGKLIGSFHTKSPKF